MHLKLTPQWEHGCKGCALVGHSKRNGEPIDLYIHKYNATSISYVIRDSLSERMATVEEKDLIKKLWEEMQHAS
jgi:hypothetical protein